MNTATRLAEVLLSSPACALWGVIFLRKPLGELLGRVRSFRVTPGGITGRLGPPKCPTSRRRKGDP